jgi:hypothetical protein
MWAIIQFCGVAVPFLSPREFRAGKAVGSEIAIDVVRKRVNLRAEQYCSEIDRLNGSRVDRKVTR